MYRRIFVPKSVGDSVRFESPAFVTATLLRYPPSDRTGARYTGQPNFGYRVQDPQGHLRYYSDHYLMILLWLTYGRPESLPEWVYRDYLWHTYGDSQKEVAIDTGIVDIMTPELVIEVKKAPAWKHAMGQVLAYSYTTGKTPVVALIGTVPQVAREVLQGLDIGLIELP